MKEKTMETLVEGMEENDLFGLDLNLSDCDWPAGYAAHRAGRFSGFGRLQTREIVLGVIALAQMLMLIYFTVAHS
jgi:hypothetical protein